MFRMLYVLALASAALYGAADFLGGLASRRASTIAIVVISQCAGLVALGLMLPFLPASSPVRGDLMWGAAAGLAGGIGVALLYRALAIGSMAIVAPITAVCAVTVPVAVAIALGERPGHGRYGRNRARHRRDRARQPAEDAGTVEPGGTGFSPVARRPVSASRWHRVWRSGCSFSHSRERAPNAGMWPLVAARSVSFVLFATVALVTRRSLRMPSNVAAIAVAGGVLDMLANLLYLLASRYGPLSIVVTLSSLYPASTVLLARTVLGDRLSALQTAGIVCALVAVLLIVGTR